MLLLRPRVSHISMFKQNQARQERQSDFQDLNEENSYEKVQKNIEKYQRTISQKQKAGFGLAKNIAESVEENKFQKEQTYEMFIAKMDLLYKSELRFRKKQKKKLSVQKSAPLYSLYPLKDTLRAYNEMTVRGFNSEIVSETLQNVANCLRARGYKARVMGDYSQSELEQSWRLTKVIEDIQFGLRPDQFYSPVHLAETSNLLAEIQYKNTDLLPHFFTKLRSLLEERFNGTKVHQTLTFENAVYGGPKNFIPRHYIFRGFESSDDFNHCLKTLLSYEDSKKGMTLNLTRSQKEVDSEVKELERVMKKTIEAAVQVKELQKDFQSTIETLRTQYFMMQEAMDKHSFLQENEYIRYDVLELQEMLVKGGYLDPDEARKSLSQEPFDRKMERAAQVFYDYVINYSPELLSPQHNDFYQAAMRSLIPDEDHGKKIEDIVEEKHNIISLSTLSQTLVGLQKQALIFRKDVSRRDYPSDMYEKFASPFEQYIKNDSFLRFDTDQHIMMERSYLKGWKIFAKESEQIIPYLREMIQTDKSDLNGQLHALNALASCKYDEPELRSQIVDNLLAKLRGQQPQSISRKAAFEGLLGLANSASLDDKSKELAGRLASKIKVDSFSFTEQIDLLWSLCNLEQYQSKALQRIVSSFNNLSFERLDHDLRFEEYDKLMDSIQALKIEGDSNVQITNHGLLEGFVGKELYNEVRFPEGMTKYDPFKKRVIQALGKGLSQASITHEIIMQDELHNQHLADKQLPNFDKYPYSPDVVMGYRGTKVGVFVLPEAGVMRDTMRADGANRLKMRLLERSQSGGIAPVSIAVPDVVTIDIPNWKLLVNQKFNLLKEVESQIGSKLQSQDKLPQFSKLAEFGRLMVTKGLQFIESLPTDKEVKQMDAFTKKIFNIFQMKQQTELRFQPEQRNIGYDQIRYQLMQLSLIYESLSNKCKEQVKEFLPNKQQSFKQLLMETAQSIKQESIKEDDHKINESLDIGWLGTRFEVELPVSQTHQLKKSIAPEIINQRFMWVDDYFHYKDWQLKQQEVFDNFNLLVIPHNVNDNKFFFDPDNYQRRVPNGIFPNPTTKRSVMQPHSQRFAQDIGLKSGQHDSLVLFEKELFKMMVLNELKKSEQLKPIDPEVSMITNLQNIKQGLKSDYSDKEILNTILLNLNLTEQLIDEHLNLGVKSQTSPQYVPRDHTNYRQFVADTYSSKDREDPFTHFYLKQAGKIEVYKNELDAELEIKRNIEEFTSNLKVIQQGEERREKLLQKVEKVLQDERIRNEDLTNLSSSLKQSVQITYDMKSLVKSENVFDMEPELQDIDISDSEYLRQARRRAESKLIKTKIIYKMSQQGMELTPKEKIYLKQWLADIHSNQDRNIGNLRDSMLPVHESKLTMKDIDAKNFYTLNSIPRVHLDRDMHGKFALNDLVLELSHFLDEEVVNKIEAELYSERLRKEWGLSTDFKVIETRNKEIGLVLDELEELAYRTAGMFNDKDVGFIKKMISVKRNKDIIDQQYYDNDMKSLDDFMASVNTYDDRIKLLERWIVRKEDEIKDRLVLPPESLKKTEQALFAQYDKPLKAARERLVAQLLTTDEHGNPIKKQYKDLTSKELAIITENITIRLNLFNYEYPPFVPHMIKAVMEHPNLLKADQKMLDNYSTIFEVDWRGDQTIDNSTNHMYTHPIYVDGPNFKHYGEVTNEKVQDKLRKACVPYVDETVQKLLSQKL